MNGENELNSDVLVASNMATTSSDFFLKQLKPSTFRKGDDVEKFIKKCEKFFKFYRHSAAEKDILIELFLDDDLQSAYSRVDENIKGYQERLRKAFGKQSTLLQDIKEALSYKQTSEDPENFFEVVERLTNKIFDERLTKETFMEQLLIEASNEKDLQRQLCLTDTEGLVGVKDKIKKLHKARKMVEEIMPIGNQKPRSYRDVVNNAHHSQAIQKYQPINNNQKSYVHTERRDDTHNRRYQNEERNRGRVVCWTCNEEGHFSRDCAKRVITCFACRRQGHVRRNCPYIKCEKCNKNGHYKNECYTNLEKMNYRRTYENDRRQGETYTGFKGTRYDSRQNGVSRETNRGYQGPNRGYQGQNRGYLGNNNRNQVASVDHYQEDRYALAVETGERYIDNDGYDIALNDMSNDENREYPKENASAEVEIVGAIY